ncbi:MAG: glycogen/starch synthase [Nibricoccus sp.]
MGRSTYMKGGILFADRVTTVSPRYAREIQTPEFGCGLDGVVQTRTDDLIGLLNGSIWRFGIRRRIRSCRRATPRPTWPGSGVSGRTAEEDGFATDFKGPVFGMVCRLTEQKGVDLVLANRRLLPKRRLPFDRPWLRRQAHGGGTAGAGGTGTAKSVALRKIGRSHEPFDRGRERFLRDAVFVRALRLEPDVFAGVRERFRW